MLSGRGGCSLVRHRAACVCRDVHESDQNQEPVQREGPGAGRFGPERQRPSDRFQDIALRVPEEPEGEDHRGATLAHRLWICEAGGVPCEGKAIRIIREISLCVLMLELLAELKLGQGYQTINCESFIYCTDCVLCLFVVRP